MRPYYFQSPGLRGRPTKEVDAVERLRATAAAHDKGIIPFAVALAIQNPAVTVAIVGAEELAACDEVWYEPWGR